VTEVLLPSSPDAWRTERLGDVCHIQAGLSRRAGRESPEGVPLVRIQNIAGGRILPDGVFRIDVPGGAGMGRYTIRPGDVVLARSGDLGRCALATEGNAGWLVGSGCLRLRPGPRLLPRYLLHYLEHPSVKYWFRASSTGSVIPSLGVRTLSDLPVAVPPTGDQQAITDIIGAMDEKILVHEEIVRSTAELRDVVAQLLFSGARPPFGTAPS
jgi:restriction endonuclease S subunit